MKNSLLFVVLLAALLGACNIPSPAVPESGTTAAPESAAPTARAPAPGGAGDIIFHNGLLLTMNDAQPTAQAILVRDERIEAVGSNDEILALRREATRVIDLGGLTVMPGFVDAHSHIFGDDLRNGRDIGPSQQMAIEFGVTTTTEMGMDAVLFEKLKAAADAGGLRMRVNAYLGYTTNCGDPMGEWWKSFTPNTEIAPRLYLRGLKIFTDGGSCKVPAVSVEYPGGSMGDLFFTQEQLNAMVSTAQASGFQVAVHALGDRAVEQSQNAIAAVLNGQPNSLRHRIEHNAVIRPDMMGRYSEIGIIPVIFGAYSTCVRTAGATDFKYLLPESVGQWEWPWRALVDANPGLPIAWHADFGPFRWIDPFYILWGFVTRNEIARDGSLCEAPAWFKQGALRVDEAIPMMTINSAHALFMDDEVGSLEPGKLADVIIASSNPLTSATDALRDIRVLMTMIGGNVEYCAAGSEALCPTAAALAAPPAAPPASAPAGPVSASAQLSESPASNVFDGDSETIWNSGSGPEQWIMIDLGDARTVASIRLIVSQHPAGETTHQVWVGSDLARLTMVREFSGNTSDLDVLQYASKSPLTGVRFIKVVTTRSPSWVAWREIEVR